MQQHRHLGDVDGRQDVKPPLSQERGEKEEGAIADVASLHRERGAPLRHEAPAERALWLFLDHIVPSPGCVPQSAVRRV